MDTPPKNYNNINKKETTLSIILNVLHFCVSIKKKKIKSKKIDWDNEYSTLKLITMYGCKYMIYTYKVGVKKNKKTKQNKKNKTLMEEWQTRTFRFIIIII